MRKLLLATALCAFAALGVLRPVAAETGTCVSLASIPAQAHQVDGRTFRIAGACYRKRGSQCVSGFTTGQNSRCDDRCTVGFGDDGLQTVAERAADPRLGQVAVTGRLYDLESPTSEPLRALTVRVYVDRAFVVSATTDEAGRFEAGVPFATAGGATARITLGDIGFVSQPDVAAPHFALVVTTRGLDIAAAGE